MEVKQESPYEDIEKPDGPVVMKKEKKKIFTGETKTKKGRLSTNGNDAVMKKNDEIGQGKGTMKNGKALQISDNNICKKPLKPKDKKGALSKIDNKDFTTKPCKTATEECGTGVTIRVASHTVDDSPETEIKDISNAARLD